MHFGANNKCARYTMLDNWDNYIQVLPVNKEKDFGVTFELNLKYD